MRSFLKACVFCLFSALLALSASSCVEIEEAFSGLIGRVGLGPVEGAVIEVYDGSQFIEFGDDSLITTGRSDERGGFVIDIPDQYIGRTLIVAARFPADDPITPGDERARYTDFSNPGTNVGAQVVLEPEDGPWVACVDFFDGLDVLMSITPWTTMGWHALQGAESSRVGAGNNRYTFDNAYQIQRAINVNLGLRADLAETIPAQPTIGGNHLERIPSDRDRDGDSIAALYSQIQLDRCARAIAAATTRADDDVSDVLRALFNDAQDAVIDGQRFGVPLPYFEEPGAPNVIGQDASGVSRFFAYLSGFGPTPAEIAAIEASTAASSYPTLAEMQAEQAQATGAIGITRIDDINTRAFPIQGGVRLRVTGSGLLHNAELVISSSSSISQNPIGTLYRIDRDSAPGEGQILSVRHDAIEVLLPNLSTQSGFALADGTQPRFSACYVYHDYDGPDRNAEDAYASLGVFSIFAADALHILEARIVRLESSSVQLPSTRQLAAQPGGTNPEALTPGVDDVYALRLEVYNGRADQADLMDLRFDPVAASAVRNGDALSNKAFGEPGPQTLVTWPSQADLSSSAINLAHGEHAQVLVRYVMDAGLLSAGTNLGYEQSFTITPRLQAAIVGTGTAVSDTPPPELPRERTTAIAADRDATPDPMSGVVSAPGSVAAGTTWSLTWEIRTPALMAPRARSFVIDRVELEVMTPGRTTRAVLADDAVSTRGIDPLFPLTAMQASSVDGGAGLPLTIVDGPATLAFDFTPAASLSGGAQVLIRAHWREPATGRSGSVMTMANVNVTP